MDVKFDVHVSKWRLTVDLQILYANLGQKVLLYLDFSWRCWRLTEVPMQTFHVLLIEQLRVAQIL